METGTAALRRLGGRQSGEYGSGGKCREDQLFHTVVSLVMSGSFGCPHLNE